MYAYNRVTGRYEKVCTDAKKLVERVKRRIRKARTASEAYEAGGDFTDMADAARRSKEA